MGIKPREIHACISMKGEEDLSRLVCSERGKIVTRKKYRLKIYDLYHLRCRINIHDASFLGQ